MAKHTLIPHRSDSRHSLPDILRNIVRPVPIADISGCQGYTVDSVLRHGKDSPVLGIAHIRKSRNRQDQIMAKKIPHIITIAAIAAIITAIAPRAHACTSAIVSGRASATGKAMLWKLRDTSSPCNFVDTIPSNGESMAYIALFNGSDSLRREAWIGYNDAGFAIMNTASHNMPRTHGAPEDREGFVMTLALQKCHDISDFRHLLDTFTRPMGVRANFGVIDAHGNGAYFETHDSAYVEYNLADSPQGFIVRTNHSLSQPASGGTGFDRKRTAETLLAPYADTHSITPQVFTEILSRSFYHAPSDRNLLSDSMILLDEHLIPRPTSEASVVIESADTPDNYRMWAMLGWPPTSYTIPASLHNLPDDLALNREDLQAPAYRKAQWNKRLVTRRIGDRQYLITHVLRQLMSRRTNYTFP